MAVRERRGRGWQGRTPREVSGGSRAAANAVAAVSADRRTATVQTSWACKLGQMGQQFVLLRQTREVMADHLVRPQRRLAARPQADEHAGDDRTVGLNLDAHRIVAEQMPAAQHVLEKAKENLDRPAVAVNQRDDPGRQVEQVRGDQQ